MNFNHKTYHIQQPAQRRQGQYGVVSGAAVERRVLLLPPSALFLPQASWREWQQISDAAEQAAQRVTVLALPPLGVRSLV